MRPCGDTVLILAFVQALAQRSDEVHVQLAEQSPGVSFTQGSASGVSLTQGSASSGSRLARSFSRSATLLASSPAVPGRTLRHCHAYVTAANQLA